MLRLSSSIWLCIWTLLLQQCVALPAAYSISLANGTANATDDNPAPPEPVFSLPYSLPYSLPRLVIYFQSANDPTGAPISLLPLITEKGIALTHLIISSFHINRDQDLVLNDWAPSDTRFDTLWSEAAILQRAGVRVMGMLGGAASGAWTTDTLDSPDVDTFEHYYGQLHNLIVQHGLQGIDLDVEQKMSQDGISRLIRRLTADFNSDYSNRFEITLAPVGSALLPHITGGNLSGFRYQTLELELGKEIAFYNAQLYNGWGTVESPIFYQMMLGNGSGLDPECPWVPEKVLLGDVTSPDNGDGYVDAPIFNLTVAAIRDTYKPRHEIGGIMGWEYFNSLPGNTAKPWVWAQEMTAILRPGLAPYLNLTEDDAHQLTAAYARSVGRRVGARSLPLAEAPPINYYDMITK
ncbi:glycoside hydrolase family 18 protein [Ophiostoma piceae UAMH 11346]|uniref:Glycoside hydrolase family 18 protein n=1 Tax=Ophiostoma piceae (strain UAMH 11346) TaxID=1262450 RepID=S3C2C5_OPHP1|nr:glycoside hydrolase family 18 protein [Ophiostoma piceae UAMH 11346]